MTEREQQNYDFTTHELSGLAAEMIGNTLFSAKGPNRTTAETYHDVAAYTGPVVEAFRLGDTKPLGAFATRTGLEQPISVS